MNSIRSMLLLATLALIPLASAENAARELDVAAAKKSEVRYGQIGPRDTLLFYAFEDKAAVLTLMVKREGDKFIMSGAVQLFAEGTTGEQLAKWINNQHSCGIFPEVPEPVGTEPLPAAACVVTASQRKEGAEKVTSPNDEVFEDHVIQFKVTGAEVDGRFKLKAFESVTGAFVKVGPAA